MTDTRILCCYSHIYDLHERTEASIVAFTTSPHEFVHVGVGTTRYWQEIAKRWDGTEDLFNIEQDIEIHIQVEPQFRDCSSLWCTFPYNVGGNLLDTGIGCVRFRAEAQRLVTPEEIQALDYGPPQDYRYIDGKISHAMAQHGVKVCVHEPPVTHWRVYP